MDHVYLKEKLTTLFQPDVLVPLQYYEAVKRKSGAIPEKDLMLALLEDAVCCFQKYLRVPDGRGRIIFKEAESWIFGEENSWVFSYKNVCDALGIDSDYLRCGLLRWKEKHLSSRLKGGVPGSEGSAMYEVEAKLHRDNYG